MVRKKKIEENRIVSSEESEKNVKEKKKFEEIKDDESLGSPDNLMGIGKSEFKYLKMRVSKLESKLVGMTDLSKDVEQYNKDHLNRHE